MVKNNKRLRNFYRTLVKNEKISYKKALAIYEGLFKEAVSLGRFNSKNILDGLEADIRMAKIINGLK